MANHNEKYTKEILQEVVSRSINYVQVLKALSVTGCYSGGMHNHIKARIASFDIDTSHFKGKSSTLGVSPVTKKHWSVLLVLRNSTYRMGSIQIRRALIESGRSYLCEWCGLEPEWRRQKLVLEVDHINGNWRDCRVENIRFLCPNCHSQTKNFYNKKVPVEPKHGPKKNRDRFQWPSDEELSKAIWERSAVTVANELGASSSGLKKRCKVRKITTPPRGYWQKLKAAA